MKTPKTYPIPTDANRTREEFWSLWNSLRSKMPGQTRVELQAADHAAWLMFKALKPPVVPQSAPPRDGRIHRIPDDIAQVNTGRTEGEGE